MVGIGNPYFGNDAAGIRVAELVEKEKLFNADVVYLSTTSFEVIDRILGYDKAFIIDTVLGEENGRIHVLRIDELDELELTGNLRSQQQPHTSHALSLGATLRVGYELFSDEMPEVEIMAIEIADVEPGICCAKEIKEIDEAIEKSFRILQQKLLINHPTDHPTK